MFFRIIAWLACIICFCIALYDHNSFAAWGWGCASGWVFNYILKEINEAVQSCLSKLKTSAAKAEMIARWQKWKGLK